MAFKRLADFCCIQVIQHGKTIKVLEMIEHTAYSQYQTYIKFNFRSKSNIFPQRF